MWPSPFIQGCESVQTDGNWLFSLTVYILERLEEAINNTNKVKSFPLIRIEMPDTVNTILMLERKGH